MADNSPPTAAHLPEDISTDASHHDASIDTENSGVDPGVMVVFDTLDNGGFVAASATHQIALFDILNCLPKDVFLAIDTGATLIMGGTPSLVVTANQLFPEMDPSSFLGTFKRYSLLYCSRT